MKKEVYIIGGGASLKAFDFDSLADKDTIVVNKAIRNVPDPNYFITMDYVFLRRMGIEEFNVNKVSKMFVANFGDNILVEKDGVITDPRFNIVYDLKEYDVVIKSWTKFGLGFTFNEFRSGNNSAYSALQLAVILGYKEINLLGVDLVVLGTDTHYHEGYNHQLEKFKKNLGDYYNCFAEGIDVIKESSDIKIYSCSEISVLNHLIPFKQL